VARIFICRFCFMRDLKRAWGLIWPESGQNRSLAEKNCALSEPQIFS
jgi:hypothetical protein